MILTIKYGSYFDSHRGSMTVDLQALCELEGKKERVQNSSGTWAYVSAYPISKARKLFKLICQRCSDDEIEQVQSFFKEHSKKYYQEFQKILDKGR